MPDDSCSFQMAGGMPVVTAPVEIDVTTAGQLRAMLTEWATRGHTTVVVDMTGTEFCQRGEAVPGRGQRPLTQTETAVAVRDYAGAFR